MIKKKLNSKHWSSNSNTKSARPTYTMILRPVIVPRSITVFSRLFPFVSSSLCFGRSCGTSFLCASIKVMVQASFVLQSKLWRKLPLCFNQSYGTSFLCASIKVMVQASFVLQSKLWYKLPLRFNPSYGTSFLCASIKVMVQASFDSSSSFLNQVQGRARACRWTDRGTEFILSVSLFFVEFLFRCVCFLILFPASFLSFTYLPRLYYADASCFRGLFHLFIFQSIEPK